MLVDTEHLLAEMDFYRRPKTRPGNAIIRKENCHETSGVRVGVKTQNMEQLNLGTGTLGFITAEMEYVKLL